MWNLRHCFGESPGTRLNVSIVCENDSVEFVFLFSYFSVIL